uniref:Fibronectin type-III domain-containing protein n=1 Tax=Iconisemion striatum TaxID=60296 RepID=A0A1A7YFG4_9TELE
MAFLLLLLGHFAAAQLISGIPTTIFYCTHDFERVYCKLNSQNCSENTLILVEHFKKQYDCPLQQCSSDQCCCSAEFILIYGEHFTAEINNRSHSKTFYVTESFKPKAPTIKSVKESNGNFQVRWLTNMDEKTWNPEETEITFYKKGDTEKVSKRITPAKNDGFQYHEINGQDLDPGATYVVSLRSFSDQSKKFSGSSQEWEFKTPASYTTLLYVLFPVLCVVFVIISAALYVCYVKLKESWWDNIPNPKVTMMHSTKPPIITPRDLINFASFKKELALNKTVGAGSVVAGNPHLERGRMRMDLHILDHPNLAKKFDLNVQTEISSSKDQSNSGSSSIVNQSYSMLVPNCSGQKQRASGSFCSSNTSGIVTDLDPQTCLFPPHHDSSSCQKKIPSYSNSITSKEFESIDGSNEWSNVFPCFPSFPGSADEMLKFKNPTYGPLPAVSPAGFIPMEDGYKPCQCQVNQSDALKSNVIEMFAQVPSSDHNQHLNRNTKEFNVIPPNSFQPAEIPAFDPFDINSPFPSMFPMMPNSSIMVVSEYHSV